MTRDLVIFTWNLKTMEGKDQVRAMLESQLATTKPSRMPHGSSPGVSSRLAMTNADFFVA